MGILVGPGVSGSSVTIADFVGNVFNAGTIRAQTPAAR
jgi:hypothetical protein